MSALETLSPRELSDKLREWINPGYAMMIGTESHERKMCADAIDSLLAQVDELQQARAICPNCSLLIDEAAGVDVAAKNRRITELEQALIVLRDRVQDEFDRTYISGVLGK